MKFAGLILICATSCLALILPAIGVVHFPKVQESQTEPRHPGNLTLSPGFPVATQGGMSPAPMNQPWMQSLPPNGQPVSPFPKEVPGQGNGLQQVTDSVPSTNKFGMGLWLLLAPVCMIGLAMWTFSPNPSGSKSRV